MDIFNKLNLNKVNIINLLIGIMPISLISGNLITNLNIILICFFGFYIYGKKIFFLTKKIYHYLIFAFFFYLIIISTFNYFNDNSFYEENFFNSIIIKSILYLRFLLVFLIINKLIEEKELNLKFLFIITTCSIFFLSTDIIIQVIFGKNILGYEITGRKASGIFGEEKIAGSFIQKFSLFFIFYLALKIKIENKKNIFLIFSFFIFFIIILLTGNRMPAILFALNIVIFFMLEKNFKKLFIVILFFISILFTFSKVEIFKGSHYHIISFFNEAKQIIFFAPKLLYYKEYPDKNIKFRKKTYILHFNTAVQLWKNKKFFGHGIKSFRYKCSYGRNLTCSTHPHNYLLELLLDVGLIGTFIIYLLFFVGIFNYFKFYLRSTHKKNKLISLIFFSIIFLEFMPIRSSGSFFTTSNSTIIFLFLAIFLNADQIKNYFSNSEHVGKNT